MFAAFSGTKQKFTIPITNPGQRNPKSGSRTYQTQILNINLNYGNSKRLSHFQR